MGFNKKSATIFGSAAKYKWLVLRISEYPLNKELLEDCMRDISPTSGFVMELPACGYGARPTESRALKIADLRRRLEEVDKALMVVPEEYRSGVLYHTIYHGSKGIVGGKGTSWSDDMYATAHPNTWKKWKTRFVLEYASVIGEKDHIDLLNEYRPTLKPPPDTGGNFTPAVIK